MRPPRRRAHRETASECLALVGESGSGKTTLARCVAGLHVSYTGETSFRDEGARSSATPRLPRRSSTCSRAPTPHSTPRKTIAQIIEQPLRSTSPRSAPDPEVTPARAALDRVQRSPPPCPSATRTSCRVESASGWRSPAPSSRSRSSWSATRSRPRSTSPCRRAIIDVLVELQRELHIGLLFVTHNLALIRTLSQEVAVTNEGRIVERGASTTCSTPAGRLHEEAPLRYAEPRGGVRSGDAPERPTRQGRDAPLPRERRASPSPHSTKPARSISSSRVRCSTAEPMPQTRRAVAEFVEPGGAGERLQERLLAWSRSRPRQLARAVLGRLVPPRRHTARRQREPRVRVDRRALPRSSARRGCSRRR